MVTDSSQGTLGNKILTKEFGASEGRHSSAHPQKQSARRYTIHHPRLTQEETARESSREEHSAAQRDYRLGLLRVDWVDFDTMDLEGLKRGNIGKEKEAAKRG